MVLWVIKQVLLLKAIGNNSIALGTQSKAAGNNSIAQGNGATAKQAADVAVGHAATADGTSLALMATA